MSFLVLGSGPHFFILFLTLGSLWGSAGHHFSIFDRFWLRLGGPGGGPTNQCFLIFLTLEPTWLQDLPQDPPWNPQDPPNHDFSWFGDGFLSFFDGFWTDFNQTFRHFVGPPGPYSSFQATTKMTQFHFVFHSLSEQVKPSTQKTRTKPGHGGGVGLWPLDIFS